MLDKKVSLKTQIGTTLIEVLITLLVVSIGLLGMAALQLRSISVNQSAFYKLQATNLASDIADRIMVNGVQASQDFYQIGLTQTAANLNAGANTVTRFDVAEWLNVVARIPGGQFSIGAANAGDDFVRQHPITVCWLEKTTDTSAACGAGRNGFQFTAVSRI